MTDTDSSNPVPSSAPSPKRRPWLWALLVLLAAIVIIMQWQRRSAPDFTAGTPAAQPDSPLAATLAELSAHTPADHPDPAALDASFLRVITPHTTRPLDPSASAEIRDTILKRFIPLLWTTSQKIEIDPAVVSDSAMSAAIDHETPIADTPPTLTLYPDSADLKTPVPAAAADALIESRIPHQWVRLFVNGATPYERKTLKNLSPGAIDRMSRALAVASLALPRLAESVPDASSTLTQQDIRAAFRRIAVERGSAQRDASRTVGPDESARAALLASLPSELFREVTATVGPDHRHRPAPSLQPARAAVPVPFGAEGGGASAADFDADGFTDLYLAGAEGGRLFRNDAGQRFIDITDSTFAPSDRSAETRAGYFVDFDNDGDLDLFTTAVARPNRLYRNDAGRLTDVTFEMGLPDDSAVTHEAVFADINNDSLLDLYIARFGDWTRGASPVLGGDSNTNAGPNRLYVQRLSPDGARRFHDITDSAGVGDTGWTHCVGALDFDADGLIDLFSLNDFGASRVYRNMGNERFSEIGHVVGLGLGALYNAMNFALLDLDHSGRPALYVTQIMDMNDPDNRPDLRDDPQTVPHRLGRSRLLRTVRNRLFVYQQQTGSYLDHHARLVEPADLGWGWDAGPIDFDNDSDPDLIVLTGTEPEADMPTNPADRRPEYLGGRIFMGMFAGEPNAFLINHRGYFFDASSRVPLAFPGNSRSAAVFDFDNDGDLDILITGFNEPARLFENLWPAGRHFIRIRLVGTRSNRDGIGASVEVRAADRSRFGWVTTNGGFLSQDPLTLHFGLADATAADSVIVRWPSGIVQELTNLPTGATHTIIEPDTPSSSTPEPTP